MTHSVLGERLKYTVLSALIDTDSECLWDQTEDQMEMGVIKLDLSLVDQAGRSLRDEQRTG